MRRPVLLVLGLAVAATAATAQQPGQQSGQQSSAGQPPEGAAAGERPTDPPAPPSGEAPAAAVSPPQPELLADIEKACTARRYGLRLAAARKVGQAGDRAAPAIRAWQQQHGLDSLPVALVEAVAEHGGIGEPVLALLDEWARDRDFYWRAQALRGLAERAAAPQLAERFMPRFVALADDPSWLTRVYARYGFHRANQHRAEPLAAGFAPETDPRARTRLAALRGRALELLPALGDARTFLGDPWGQRRAAEAYGVVRRFGAGDDAPTYTPGAPFATNAAAIAALTAAVRQVTGEPVAAVEPLTDPDVTFAGGLEVSSCRNGDLHLRWTGTGRVYVGLDAARDVQLDATRWQQLSAAATALTLESFHGVVICDKLRIAPAPGMPQCVVAPGALPAAAADWLKRLAAAIEEAGDRELAAALRDRLTQFAAS